MRILSSSLLVIAGAVLIVSGLVYDLMFAGLPYQDPKAEMQETSLRHKRVSDVVVLLGIACLGVGAVWKIAATLIGRRKTDQQG